MTPGRREDKCPSARAGKDRAPVALKGPRLRAAPSLRGRSAVGFCLFRPVICLLLMMLLFLLLLLLLFFFFCCSDYCLFCCSPAYAFSGRPSAGGLS